MKMVCLLQSSSNVIDSKWGIVPGSIAQATNTFTNNLNNRRLQDLGLDGLDEIQEREKFSEYLNQVRQNLGKIPMSIIVFFLIHRRIILFHIEILALVQMQRFLSAI